MPMELAERLSINDQCEVDYAFREKCRRRIKDGDYVFAINAFFWTFDPRPDPKTKRPIGEIPFLLWEQQETVVEFLRDCIHDGEDGALKKSRDVGATWMVLDVIFLEAIIVQSFQALMGTRIEDLLDTPANPDCLFWKLDFNLDWIPHWLYPEGYDPRTCRTWRKMYIPSTGASIIGEAPTRDFGRSGRKTVALLDEWAAWQNGRASAASVMGTTPCRLFVATPSDRPDNHYDELLHQKKDYANTFVRQQIIHWTHDPRKNQTAIDPITKETYYPFKLKMIGDARKGIPGRITKDEFAREYDIDFEGSIKDNIYKEQIAFSRIGKFPFDPRLPLYAAIDFGVNDVCVIVWVQWDYNLYRYRFIDCYANNGHGIGFYAPIIKGTKPGEITEYDPFYSHKDLEAIERRNSWKQAVRNTEGGITHAVPYADIFGDPAGRQRAASDGRSAIAVLDEDFNILVKSSAKNDDRFFNGRIRESRQVITYADFDIELCGPLFTFLKVYRIDKKTGKPEHDESSNYAAAVQYFSVNSPHQEDLRRRGEATPGGSHTFNGSIFGDPNSIEDGRSPLRVYGSVSDYDKERFYASLTEDEDDAPSIRKRKGKTGYGF